MANRSKFDGSGVQPKDRVPWLERRISRRAVMKKGAVGGSVLMASLYVKPSMRALGVTPAYAAGTQFTPEGCTPGLWKNHSSLWTAPYNANPTFESAFGNNVFAPKTLLEVLQQGGGGVISLGRHAVAALLNAADPDVSYPLTVAQVIQKFNDALTNNTIEATKNEFEVLNEGSCDAKEGLSLRADPD